MQILDETLGIDPGPEESGWVHMTGVKVIGCGHDRNADILEICRTLAARVGVVLAVEWVQHYGSGMAAGKDVYRTCAWAGRFVEVGPVVYSLVTRPRIKTHITGQARAKDGNVRQAILDRFGGRQSAMGRKAAPGPLYGVSGHAWAALAVALTVHDLGPGCGELMTSWR